MAADVDLPFEPENGSIDYVSADNVYMQAAREVALEESLDDNQPVGGVLVRDGEVLGRGANGSTYHDEHGCDREALKEAGEIGSGEGYELCDGCHPENHAEPTTIQDAYDNGADDLAGAEMYMWGHWYACEWCWDALEEEGIDQLYLLEGSEELFNKESGGFIF